MTAPMSPEREAQIRNLGDDEHRTVLTMDNALDDTLAELDRTRAEHEPYEALTEQGCQAGKHPTWLVDSPDHHACPWCQIEQLRHELRELAKSDGEHLERLRTERDELKKRLHDAAMTKTWTNEDGKKFVFVEDIAPHLLGTKDTTR